MCWRFPFCPRVLNLMGCLQDFMGFLHLGWDSAMRDDQLDVPLVQLGPAWAEVARSVNLDRPGLPCVRRIMGWSPLHIAAMEGEVCSTMSTPQTDATEA